MKKLLNCCFWSIISMFIMFMFSENVSANYSEVCNGGEIASSSLTYKKCDNHNIYLMPGNDHSSYIVASEDLNNNKQILYAGKIDGIDTFYATRFKLYREVYDDRGLFSGDKNMWMDLSINGVVEYDGKFNDNILVDESEHFLQIYNEVGTYLLRQYFKDKMVGSIRVIVMDRLDSDLHVDSAYLGEQDMKSREILRNQGNLSFAVSGGKYGFESKVNVKVNSCNIMTNFSKELVIKYADFASCLIDNDTNRVTLTLTNGVGMVNDFKYSFKLVGESVSIKLFNSISTVATTSRRIVIKPSAGQNKSIDTAYNLYYWSTSPSDELTYESFMSHYADSEHKGSYNSNTGVILRNEEGTYYLYALAKDDDSVTVVRSDEYVLTNQRQVNRVSKSNVIFVAIMVVVAALPIFIYLLIREKDTV